MTTTAKAAADRYNAKAEQIRATMDRSSREYAAAMQTACDEYEAAMVAAARQGDRSARRAVEASRP